MSDIEMSDHVRQKFSNIYKNDTWIGGSGPGSHPSNTVEYRAFISKFISENGVTSVTDLGCGDWQFSRLMDWSGVQYTGLDLVSELIETNKKKFGSENIDFSISEGAHSLPGGDLVLCKEVLQHLPTEMVKTYLQHITRKYKWALITNSINPGSLNIDIEPGGYRPLDISLPPFNVRCAVVLVYFPFKAASGQIWRNKTFLIFGNGQQGV